MFDILSLILLMSIFFTLLRFLKGPTLGDRVVAFDVMGIMAVSLLIILALYFKRSLYLDIALIMGLIGFLGATIFGRYIERDIDVEYVGFAFLSLGSLFFLISAIGLLRMPDIYTRMHVGTKSTTIATLLIIIGACFMEPAWSFKLLLVGVFVLLTNPLSSSVIARASHKDAQKLKLDEYKEQE